MKGVADFFVYQSYKQGFFFLYAVLPVCIFSVYISTYLLFPFLQKKRYSVFITGIVGLIIFNCFAALFFYVIIRPYLCPVCDAIDLREDINIMGNNGINIASFMTLVALGIKFTKNWYLQQIHNRMLARKKIVNELKLLKTRIQPGFLFESLQSLYNKISSDKNQAAGILLKFSELLSYMLYECNDDFVLVKNVLMITNEFIELEKMMKETKLTFAATINSGINGKYIPSFILLPLIQNCVIALHNNLKNEPDYMEIEIYAQNNILYCSISIQPSNTGAVREIYADIINTFTNRLEIFYSNNYTLKLAEKEEGKFIITLSLLLLDNLPSTKVESPFETKHTYTHV